VLEDVEAVEGRPMEVRVVGEQFAWTFFYERDGEEVASRELYVPLDRQVRFTLQSKDVLHDFWVPAFRMKKDAVPGIDVTYTVTPNREGRYPIVCAELCGLGHAVMRSSAVVVPEQEFTSWLTDLGKPAEPEEGGGGAGGGETDGKAIFASQNCGSCHALADAGTTGAVGPDLDDVLADKDEAFIKTSIEDPEAEIADGYQGGIMPPNYAQTIPGPQMDALVTYLSEVTKGG
jgi:cytochrome c oxidase subunit 2